MWKRPIPDKPAPGQESVWDYPRPPRLEEIPNHLKVVLNGVIVAETREAKRVLETSHPPVYFFPPSDIKDSCLVPVKGSTFCEWKGEAVYYDVVVGDRRAPRAAFAYPSPTKPFASLRYYLSFYAGPMDGCFVDGERVTPQPGEFYSGWITANIAGPFKGRPGSEGW